MLFNSPLSSDKANNLIEILNLTAASQVIDLGCGEGEFLHRLHLRYHNRCYGVDLDPSLIEKTKKKWVTSPSKLWFEALDVQQLPMPKTPYDAAVCIGSTHAFGLGQQAYPVALQAMCKLVKPKGLLLLGEGFWQQPPAQEYLAFLGDPVGIYHNHEQNIAMAEAMGLAALYACVSSQDEWDHFEWCHLMKAERAAVEDPENPQVLQKLQVIRTWNQHYRVFGRGVMGFGFYVFQTP